MRPVQLAITVTLLALLTACDSTDEIALTSTSSAPTTVTTAPPAVTVSDTALPTEPPVPTMTLSPPASPSTTPTMLPGSEDAVSHRLRVHELEPGAKWIIVDSSGNIVSLENEEAIVQFAIEYSNIEADRPPDFELSVNPDKVDSETLSQVSEIIYNLAVTASDAYPGANHDNNRTRLAMTVRNPRTEEETLVNWDKDNGIILHLHSNPDITITPFSFDDYYLGYSSDDNNTLHIDIAVPSATSLLITDPFLINFAVVLGLLRFNQSYLMNTYYPDANVYPYTGYPTASFQDEWISQIVQLFGVEQVDEFFLIPVN